MIAMHDGANYNTAKTMAVVLEFIVSSIVDIDKTAN